VSLAFKHGEGCLLEDEAKHQETDDYRAYVACRHRALVLHYLQPSLPCLCCVHNRGMGGPSAGGIIAIAIAGMVLLVVIALIQWFLCGGGGGGDGDGDGDGGGGIGHHHHHHHHAAHHHATAAARAAGTTASMS
jgi:hypothetical protein